MVDITVTEVGISLGDEFRCLVVCNESWSTACRDTAQEGDRHLESNLGVVGGPRLAFVDVDSSYSLQLLNRAIWNFGLLSRRHVIGVGAVVIFIFRGSN